MRLLMLKAAALQAVTGRHHYVSTGCQHGRHDYCQAPAGRAGRKTPACCKFCTSSGRCLCRCHRGRR